MDWFCSAVDTNDVKSEADWHEQVVLEVGPHPELSDSQQEVIAVDYRMQGGKVKIPDHKELLYYAIKRLGLDTDSTARRPQDQQIVLLNSKKMQDNFLPVQGSTDQGQGLQVFGDTGDMFW